MRSWVERVRRAAARAVGSGRFAVQYVDVAPAVARPGVIYMIGDETLPRGATLLCPRGCGALIHVTLEPGKPDSRAAVLHRDHTVTLRAPLFCSTPGCGDFTLERSRAKWLGPR